MKSFSSLTAVIALWLVVSFGLWLSYRLFRQRGHTHQRKLLNDALRLIDEGNGVFSAFRKASVGSGGTAGYTKRSQAQEDERLREDVRNLLNSIEASSDFFERVNAAKERVQSAFKVQDFQPLSEILQIRRDFWAAAEVFLMDDIQLLGEELADEDAYEAFRQEAKMLLFSEEASSGFGTRIIVDQDDPVVLRLGIARDEASAFLLEVDSIIARQKEEDRFPTAREIFAMPWRVSRSGTSLLIEFRYLTRDAMIAAQNLARAMASKGLKGAAEELRRIRGNLPGQFAAAFERAGGLARQGGHRLKRHYEFLLEAQELRTRYAELLAKAPELSEKGKQFLARLELEKKAEQFKETSHGALSWSRKQLVIAIAHLIRALQYIQAKLTPRENKQLVLRPGEKTVSNQDQDRGAERHSQATAAPIRVLLPPASHPETKRRSGQDKRRETVTRHQGAETVSRAGSTEEIIVPNPSDVRKGQEFRLRDLVSGDKYRSPAGEKAAKPKSKAKQSMESKPRLSHNDGIMKTSFKELLAEADSGDESSSATAFDEPHKTVSYKPSSLLDRLSTVNSVAITEAEDAPNGPSSVKDDAKKSRFQIFKSKRG